MSRLIRIQLCWLMMVLAISVSCFSTRLQAGMQLDIVGKFQNADLELDVVTVFDSNLAASRSKVALLGIATPSRGGIAAPSRHSFSFRSEEWLSLIGLWTKAAKTQSDSWRVIGSMTESETSDVSQLTVSAGRGVKFVIGSFKKGTATYLLSKDDFAGFETALYRVKDFLSRPLSPAPDASRVPDGKVPGLSVGRGGGER
jgi:hypothetical protein